MFTYTLDLSRYTDKQVVGMLDSGIITRKEYDTWLANKDVAFQVTEQMTPATQSPKEQPKAFGSK